MRGELLAVQILVCNSGSEKSVRVYWQQQCVWQGLVYKYVCTGSSNVFAKVWFTSACVLAAAMYLARSGVPVRVYWQQQCI